ncbi:hypothetical protein AVEN_1340-1 [Araneus ventricosus]|uniref:Tc1-like transposase DDE domain-containing protein n=1 Tax=Araneus ventricosus TaxID=182803 RepID=A0A4Y2D4I2_ARAVE|nr:hypothetical protein AVEN_1340-1 [Araneus ventricosus]
MDDNARPHRVTIADDFLESEGIVRMEWPAYSPDLNPVENLWDALDRAICRRFPPPASHAQRFRNCPTGGMSITGLCGGRRFSTLRQHCSWVSGYNIPPAVDRQGGCHGIATKIPDITPLDFYLWGYVKQHVYGERINYINHLKQRITDVIHSVTPDVLTRVWEELDYRLDACRATNGAHTELR